MCVWCAASVILRGGSGCGYWSKSLFREFVTVLYDVRMKTLVTLLLACCFGSAMAQSSLPACPSSVDVVWNNCYGTYNDAYGWKYVGEFKDGNRNGQGILFRADSQVSSGIWKDNMLISTAK